MYDTSVVRSRGLLIAIVALCAIQCVDRFCNRRYVVVLERCPMSCFTLTAKHGIFAATGKKVRFGRRAYRECVGQGRG